MKSMEKTDKDGSMVGLKYSDQHIQKQVLKSRNKITSTNVSSHEGSCYFPTILTKWSHWHNPISQQSPNCCSNCHITEAKQTWKPFQPENPEIKKSKPFQVYFHYRGYCSFKVDYLIPARKQREVSQWIESHDVSPLWTATMELPKGAETPKHLSKLEIHSKWSPNC